MDPLGLDLVFVDELTRDQLRAFVDALPEHVVCVVDEAYSEYVLEDDFPNAIEEYVKAGHPRVAVTRTFSKIHGLAAERIGWAYGFPA